MNKTKRTLLMVSGILSLVEAAVFVIMLFSINSLLDRIFQMAQDAVAVGAQGFEGLTEAELGLVKNFLTVMFVVFAVTTTLAGIFTLVSISDPKKFQKKRGLYIAGAVFTILSGFLSISSILYYIAFTFKDNEESEPAQPNEYDIERKVKLLRELKEREEITPEEFRKRLSDMLDKDK